MAVLLHDRPEAAGQKQREALRLPRTSAVVALFAFSSRMDRDSMRLFARTHGDEVRAAAIASTGQEVLELLHGGLRPQVLVLDALLTKPSVTQILQEISTMQPDPEPAVLVLVPVPEETAARKALGLFAQYRIMLRPYGMKNLFDEIYRMGTTDDEHRLYHLRRCCEDVLDDFGARSTLNGYRYAERMLLYALYAERPQKIGDLQQYVASEENIEIGTVTSALNRMSAGMSKRGAEPCGAHYAALHAGSALLQGQRPGSAARCRRPADREAMERTPAPRGRAGPAAGCRLHKRHGLGADRRGGAGYELAVHAARRAAARRHGADLAHRASR